MSKIRLGPQTWLFPAPALLVGALVDGKPNFMTVAWSGIVCSVPPLLGVAIRHERLTMKGIKEGGAFSVNIPSADLADKVDFCGVYSGKKKDKSGLFEVFYGALKNVPLIAECPCCLECEVTQLVPLGTHVWVIGEIKETHLDEDCLDGKRPIIEKINPLAYLPGTQEYRTLGPVVREAFRS